MTKKQLRRLYTEKRQQLSSSDYTALNRQLLHQFQQLDFSTIRYLHSFLPVTERREPDTLLLCHWLKTAHPHITLLFPKANFTDCSMQSFADDGHLQLKNNPLGIPEPVAGTIIDDQMVDLILVPLLTFDRQGHRVGYGKGFYDRFIARCRPDIQVTGLSLFAPVDQIDDLHEFDAPMQRCITPEKMWNFI